MGSSNVSEHKFKLACLYALWLAIGNGKIIQEFK